MHCEVGKEYVAGIIVAEKCVSFVFVEVISISKKYIIGTYTDQYKAHTIKNTFNKNIKNIKRILDMTDKEFIQIIASLINNTCCEEDTIDDCTKLLKLYEEYKFYNNSKALNINWNLKKEKI